MKPILEISSVSKTFRLQHEQQPYSSLRESMMGIFSRSKTTKETFHALDNISFNVNAGESIGIIGKNGAGKSTLLKILSRITPPSSGTITVRGRIASLLEVGTGFHPELTGRENVFLNGSILGMTRREIAAKFDEIVDFSGTERFLDTPLKHFSSGMQLRLAFAVAAFLEPEILIIDEVLAVGDAEFQKRCIGKMESVSKSGRTVLFVSHNLGAVQALCEKTIYLHQGKIKEFAKSGPVIQQYLNEQSGQSTVVRKLNETKKCFVHEVSFNQDQEAGILKLSVKVESKMRGLVALDIRLANINMEPAAFGSIGTFDPDHKLAFIEGSNIISMEIKTDQLANGLYYVSIDLKEPDKEYYDRAEQALLIEIANQPIVPHGRSMQLDWNLGTMKLEIQRTT